MRMQFRDKLKVDLPAWHHSDSTNSAVAVGKLLGLQCLRCVVHVLAIAAQMVQWEQFKHEKQNRTYHLGRMQRCRPWRNAAIGHCTCTSGKIGSLNSTGSKKQKDFPVVCPNQIRMPNGAHVQQCCAMSATHSAFGNTSN